MKRVIERKPHEWRKRTGGLRVGQLIRIGSTQYRVVNVGDCRCCIEPTSRVEHVVKDKYLEGNDKVFSTLGRKVNISPNSEVEVLMPVSPKVPMAKRVLAKARRNEQQAGERGRYDL